MINNFNFTHTGYLHDNMLYKLVVISNNQCLVLQFFEAGVDGDRIGWELITDDYITLPEADYLVQQRINNEE